MFKLTLYLLLSNIVQTTTSKAKNNPYCQKTLKEKKKEKEEKKEGKDLIFNTSGDTVIVGSVPDILKQK